MQTQSAEKCILLRGMGILEDFRPFRPQTEFPLLHPLRIVFLYQQWYYYPFSCSDHWNYP